MNQTSGKDDQKEHASLYTGLVYHGRHKPFAHHFKYRVFTIWLNLDRLESIQQDCRLFSVNRWNVFSYFHKDHGKRDGSNVKDYIVQAAKDKGIDLEGGSIYFLGFPRVWGFVFNPLSIFYCYDKHGKLCATLQQVKNTFGEQHSYLLPVERTEDSVISQECEKVFHVSPFIEMDCTYKFRLTDPKETFHVAIHQFTGLEKILTATWSGERRSFSTVNILKSVARLPFMTLKIIAAIHWQALKLWIKGAKYISKPEPPKKEIS
jgi:hypothetical protein